MSINATTIALVIPYFGKAPSYYPYWLFSAGLNPTIDFHIFTDSLDNVFNAPNIIIHRTNFSAFVERFRQTLGISINCPSPYKLCDLRPAYGLVLSDELSSYDFWGYCDIDIILGNIREFLPDDANTYDKLFEHGHFTLIRNTDECRRNFLQITPGICSYQKVFSQPGNFCFDESDLSLHLWKNRRVYRNDKIFYDISPKYMAFSSARRHMPHWIPQIFQFTNGRLLCHTANSHNDLTTYELCYVHFQGRHFSTFCSALSDFLLTPQGFMDSVEINNETVQRLGTKPRLMPYNLMWMKKEWKRYQNKILYETFGIMNGVYIVPKRKFYVPG